MRPSRPLSLGFARSTRSRTTSRSVASVSPLRTWRSYTSFIRAIFEAWRFIRAAGISAFLPSQRWERQSSRYRSSEQPLRGEGGAVAKRAQLLPYQFFGDMTHAGRRFEAAVRSRHDAMRVIDDACNALDSIRHDLGMFDVVGGRVDDTGDERHPRGEANGARSIDTRARGADSPSRAAAARHVRRRDGAGCRRATSLADSLRTG